MKSNTVTASIVLFQHSHSDLKKTLTSLLNQPEIKRIILIDNGGALWASEILDTRISYISSIKNIGFGCAHNLAIRQFSAESDYFLICNPDVYFEKNTVKIMIDDAEKSAAALFMPRIVYPDGSNQELCKLLPSPITLFFRRFLSNLARWTDQAFLLRHADFDQSFFSPYLSGCFMFCKSKALIDLDGFDERFFMYMEDLDLSRRFASKYGNLYLPSATVFHEFNKGSYHNKKLLAYHIVSAIKYFNKWGWFFDRDRKKLNEKCLKELPINNNYLKK